MIHLVILELLKLAKKVAESGRTSLLETYKEKISLLRRSFCEIKEDLEDHGKKMKQYQRQQRDAWETLKSSWENVVDRFGRRLDRAIKGEEESTESCEEELTPVEAAPTPSVVVAQPVLLSTLATPSPVAPVATKAPVPPTPVPCLSESPSPIPKFVSILKMQQVLKAHNVKGRSSGEREKLWALIQLNNLVSKVQ
jgi:hypothetical protein